MLQPGGLSSLQESPSEPQAGGGLQLQEPPAAATATATGFRLSQVAHSVVPLREACAHCDALIILAPHTRCVYCRGSVHVGVPCVMECCKATPQVRFELECV